MIQHKVDAPCTGRAAKELGTSTLEEKTGMAVKFVSYQEAQGRPEVQLDDDDKIQRGAILNFSVNMDTFLQQHRNHTNLLQGLYDSKLRSLISKFSSRFITTPVAPTDMQNRGGVASLFVQSPQRASAAEAALAAVGSLMTAQEFAAGLDLAYAARNGEQRQSELSLQYALNPDHLKLYAAEQHVNTNEQLEYEFKCMRKAGVVQLMADVLPLECLIVRHYEVFMQLLQGRN